MSNLTEGSPATLENPYRREFGEHHFTSVDGYTILGISAANYDDFIAGLTRYNGRSDIILSPELITSELPIISPIDRNVTEERLAAIMEISQSHPDSLLLVGTAIFAGSVRPHNTMLFLKGGQEIGRYYKSPYVSLIERQWFERPRNLQMSSVPDRSIYPAICSDLLFHARPLGVKTGSEFGFPTYEDPLTRSEVRTLVVSSCWSTPANNDPEINIDPRIRYLGPLEQAVDIIFSRYPHLEEIIMIDRSNIDGPVNAHFKR